MSIALRGAEGEGKKHKINGVFGAVAVVALGLNHTTMDWGT